MPTGPGTLCQVRHARFDVQIYAIFFESPLIVTQNFGFVGDKGKIFLPRARIHNRKFSLPTFTLHVSRLGTHEVV